MIKIELAPEVARGRIIKCVKDITGVIPDIQIACPTRVCLTINTTLTPAKVAELSLALNDLPHFNWGVTIKVVAP